jgi:hypothetical protein
MAVGSRGEAIILYQARQDSQRRSGGTVTPENATRLADLTTANVLSGSQAPTARRAESKPASKQNSTKNRKGGDAAGGRWLTVMTSRTKYVDEIH